MDMVGTCGNGGGGARATLMRGGTVFLYGEGFEGPPPPRPFLAEEGVAVETAAREG